MAGLFQVNPNFGGRSGWNLFEPGATGLSIPLEVGWRPSFGAKHLLGHYKVSFDEDTSSNPDLFRSTNGQPIAVSGLPGQPHNGRRMYYVLVDQMLVRTGKSDTDGLIVFGGAVHTDYATSPLENQVFGGVVSTASFIGRPQDDLGFAASWFQVSGALTATQELEQALDEPLTGGGLLASSLGVPVGLQSHEAELEAEYTAKVYRGVFITPDIQYIINPDGTSRIRSALCVALRCRSTRRSNERQSSKVGRLVSARLTSLPGRISGQPQRCATAHRFCRRSCPVSTAGMSGFTPGRRDEGKRYLSGRFFRNREHFLGTGVSNREATPKFTVAPVIASAACPVTGKRTHRPELRRCS